MFPIKLHSLVLTMVLISVTDGEASSSEEAYPIVIANSSGIGMIHTNTETMTFMPGEYNNVLFLDYHFSTHYIFWSDYDGFAIYRLPYRPGFRTTAEKIITAKRPAGVAVDGINDHLYWAENGGYQIYRSNLDGSNNTVIINLSSPPLDLELDIPNRLLYCTTDNLGNEEILKCSLDDGNCQVLFPTSQLGVNIAIDFEENRMYWTSYDPTSYIKSSFFDGSNLRSIGIKNNAFGIDVSITHIYYGDMSKGLWKVGKANSTNEVLLYADNRVSAVKVFKPRDECSSDKTVANANKRSSDYILDTSEDTVLSDHDLEMKWYRIISDNGDMMPTSAPGCNHCGTVNPIWLNGSMPIYDEGTVTRAACLQTKEDICKSTIDIQIRICGSYYLYYLQSSPENSSFCFGNGKVSCPAGMSSETGYYPGCTTYFPKEIVSVKVSADLTEGSSTPVFRCIFVDVSEGSYVYDIHWFINEVNVESFLREQFSSINSTVLTITDWISNINIEVKCSLRMRYSNDSGPGFHLYSQPYRAGFFDLSNSNDVSVNNNDYKPFFVISAIIGVCLLFIILILIHVITKRTRINSTPELNDRPRLYLDQGNSNID